MYIIKKKKIMGWTGVQWGKFKTDFYAMYLN